MMCLVLTGCCTCPGIVLTIYFNVDNGPKVRQSSSEQIVNVTMYKGSKQRLCQSKIVQKKLLDALRLCYSEFERLRSNKNKALATTDFMAWVKMSYLLNLLWCPGYNEASRVAKDRENPTFFRSKNEVLENTRKYFMEMYNWCYEIVQIVPAEVCQSSCLSCTRFVRWHPSEICHKSKLTHGLKSPRTSSTRLSFLHSYEYRRCSKYWSHSQSGGRKECCRLHDICFERSQTLMSIPTWLAQTSLQKF